MNLKLVFGTVLLVAMLAACDKEESEVDCCTIIDTYMDFRFQDSEGNNLIEVNDWTIGDFKVYYFTSENWEIGNNNIMMIDREDESCLRIFASEEIVEDQISMTKLILPGDLEDVIKTELSVSGSNTMVTKLWYNDQLLWEVADSDDRFFTIEK